jgi:hypothetical protein
MSSSQPRPPIPASARARRHVLHTPRIVALWVAEWAARAHLGRLGRALEGAFRMLERVLGALPSRRWTAHFIVAECRAQL